MKRRNNTEAAAVQGISFTSDLLPRAKKRAKQRRRSLSAHICDLIHEDLEKAKKEAA